MFSKDNESPPAMPPPLNFIPLSLSLKPRLNTKVQNMFCRNETYFYFCTPNRKDGELSWEAGGELGGESWLIMEVVKRGLKQVRRQAASAIRINKQTKTASKKRKK